MQWIQVYLHHKEFWKPLVLTLQRLDGSFQVTGLRLCVNVDGLYYTINTFTGSSVYSTYLLLIANSCFISVQQNKEGLYCAVSTDMSAVNTEQHLPRQLFLRPDINQG